MERFCKDLKEHAIKIINYKKNDSINKWRKKVTLQAKSVIYAKKNFMLMIRNSKKLETIAITPENIEELPMIFVI